jgi:hypothetical protein
MFDEEREGRFRSERRASGDGKILRCAQDDRGQAFRVLSISADTSGLEMHDYLPQAGSHVSGSLKCITPRSAMPPCGSCKEDASLVANTMRRCAR